MDRNELIADLPAPVRALLQQCDRALRAGDRAAALASARQAAKAAPDHPEVLRQLAAALTAHGPSPEALAAIEQALEFRPDDAAMLTTHALVLQANARPNEAIESFRLASELAPESANNAYNLGRALYHLGDDDESLTALDRALALDPEHRNARATAADVLNRLGRTDAAVAHLSYLIERNPRDVRSLTALTTLRPAAIDVGMIQTMTTLFDSQTANLDDRIRLGFALGKLHATRQHYADSYAAYSRANALVRARVPWNVAGHARAINELLVAFAKPSAAQDRALGNEMIFIVSLPRSGSTLTEQILAAHPQVDAGDERNDVFNVIEDESRRRKQALAQWAPLATAQDWQRLGEGYLARSRHWRAHGTHATDKLPGNWLWLGALAAMLPGAHVIDCRRDLLETAWSCYCHLFRIGTQDFSYDFDSIAAYARDYTRALTHWNGLYPQRIRTQSYEALIADPETQTRQLLEWCGLEFDPACLRFWEAQRSVRTASAAQVREPIRRDTARADRYGALLDPLRVALGLPLFPAE
ncbi:MAG: sulfotransferase [Rudaea sp.]